MECNWYNTMKLMDIHNSQFEDINNSDIQGLISIKKITSWIEYNEINSRKKIN